MFNNSEDYCVTRARQASEKTHFNVGPRTSWSWKWVEQTDWRRTGRFVLSTHYTGSNVLFVIFYQDIKEHLGSIYVPTLTYGYELWAVTERTRSQIQAAELGLKGGWPRERS